VMGFGTVATSINLVATILTRRCRGMSLGRMPVYVWQEGTALLRMQPTIVAMIVGVVAGTFLGRLALGRIPEPIFKRVVSGLVLILGIALFFQR